MRRRGRPSSTCMSTSCRAGRACRSAPTPAARRTLASWRRSPRLSPRSYDPASPRLRRLSRPPKLRQERRRMTEPVVIGLSAVIIAIQGDQAVVLTVRPHDVRTSRPSTLAGLPFGPFDPEGQRTFELALRAFVAEQTRFELGYVEQLYTFGDRGRDAPAADLRAMGESGAARAISV